MARLPPLSLAGCLVSILVLLLLLQRNRRVPDWASTSVNSGAGDGPQGTSRLVDRGRRGSC